jgi:penicillin amidase
VRWAGVAGAALAALALAPAALATPPPGAAPAVEVLPVAGLKAPVDILIDRWGVPHLYAKN